MPRDEYGRRADMWIDMNSPVSRNNPGQLYETGLNFISDFAQMKIKETYTKSGSDEAFEELMDFYSDVNPNYEKRIREVCTTSYDKKGIVKDAIETSLKIWVPPFLDTLTPSDEDFWNALENMKKWQIKWGAEKTRVTYKTQQADGSGKEFVTEEKFVIASKAILHLHKIPEITAPGPASVNHIGIPTKSPFESKHFPVSTNPYRFGEDELRVISMDNDIREVTRFQTMMSNSPKGVIKAIQTILRSPSPTKIARIPISNGDLFKSSAVHRLFHSITATLGVQTKSTKVDSFEVPDEITESVWKTDIVDFSGDRNTPSSRSSASSVKRAKNKKERIQRFIDDINDIGDNDD